MTINIFKKYPELKNVIINLKSGTVFKGVIRKIQGNYTILVNSEILQDRGQAIKKSVDGEIVIESSEIDFIQVL